MDEKDVDIQLLEVFLKLEAALKEFKEILCDSYGFNFKG